MGNPESPRDRMRLRVPSRIRFWLFGVGVLFGILIGFYAVNPLAAALGLTLSPMERAGVIALVAVVWAPVFAYLGPAIVDIVIGFGWWLERGLLRKSTGDILAGVFGLIFGLIISNLIGSAFGQIPWIGRFIPAISAVVLGTVGWLVAVNKKPDVVAWVRASRVGDFLSRSGPPRGQDVISADPCEVPKILDSSAIIDGRIADVAKTGFLDGPLVIPSFVLDEVQRIADSSEGIRRTRGRRGLDILNRMQEELDIEVRVERMDSSNDAPVDTRLLEAARRLEGKVVTNDYNLNKVAALQGVSVLNINDLSNAVKPMVIPGEQMEVFILREGKEEGQGVAYLDDGTMVVVDEGRSHVGHNLSVVVTSVLQTSAGRMIFTKPGTTAEAE